MQASNRSRSGAYKQAPRTSVTVWRGKATDARHMWRQSVTLTPPLVITKVVGYVRGEVRVCRHAGKAGRQVHWLWMLFSADK